MEREFENFLETSGGTVIFTNAGAADTDQAKRIIIPVIFDGYSEGNQASTVLDNGIVITEPLANESVRLPVRVRGTVTSSDWTPFEGYVALAELVDANGKILSALPVEQNGSVFTLPADLDFLLGDRQYDSYHETSTGVLRLTSYGAADFDRISRIEIPLRFAAYSKDSSHRNRNLEFEAVVKNYNENHFGELLAPEVYFVLQASGCCGDMSRSEANAMLTDRIKNFNDGLNFEVLNQTNSYVLSNLSCYEAATVGSTFSNEVLIYRIDGAGRVDHIYIGDSGYLAKNFFNLSKQSEFCGIVTRD